MPIVNMDDLLNHAYRNGYAVGSFNLVSLDFLKGIIRAAEQTHSSVILGLSEAQLKQSDIELLMPAIEAAARKAMIPVAIQFNNCTSMESAIQAINLGCNSIMIDTSDSPRQKIIAITSEVVKMAHGCGVSVEGRVNFLSEIEDKNIDSHLLENTYNTIEEINDYVKKTQVDVLDVAIKSIPESAEKKPNPDYQLLKQINEALDIPLAVQGRMEFSDEQYRRLNAHGVSKIHFNMILSDVLVKQNQKNTRDDLSGFIENIISVATNNTERYMHLLGSENRAADVLAHCHPWTPVEHLIIYNVEKLDEDETKAMIAEGKKVLSTIPGVREVFTGEAVQENAGYRYTWLVRFCHPLVIDSYRVHPVHVAFADKLFRPVAGERISIDYQTII